MNVFWNIFASSNELRLVLVTKPFNMLSTSSFRTLALSFPGTQEHPHFDRTAFKVTGKRIFASLHEPSRSANIKLPPADQAVFCEYDAEAIYPVPKKFGLQGWTTFELDKLPEEMVFEALIAAHGFGSV
jgi:hypothetical protein